MRGRLMLLAPVSAVLMACGAGQPERDDVALRDDPALGAELLPELASADYARAVASMRACQAEPRLSRGSASAAAQARSLLDQARQAQLEGDTTRAHTLLRQAVAADPANAAAVYHLARSSESRGDTSAAVTSYCRFLRLDPSDADAAETRARLLALWQPYVTAPGPALASTPANGDPSAQRRAVRQTRPARRVAAAVAPRPLTQAPRLSEPADEVVYTSNGAATDATVSRSSASVPIPPTVERVPVPAPRPTRDPYRGAKRGAVIGAAAGAITGAAAGGKLKHVLIGTAAGALLGAAAGQAVSGGN